MHQQASTFLSYLRFKNVSADSQYTSIEKWYLLDMFNKSLVTPMHLVYTSLAFIIAFSGLDYTYTSVCTINYYLY